MTGWRDDLLRITGELRERVLDTADLVADRITGTDPRVAVVPYLGYGTAERVLVLGRVLRGGAIGQAASGDSRWRNMVNSYRRLTSDPVPRARVSVRVGGVVEEVEADDEGFVRAWVALPARALGGGLLPADLELVAPRAEGDPASQATAQVLVPGAGAASGTHARTNPSSSASASCTTPPTRTLTRACDSGSRASRR